MGQKIFEVLTDLGFEEREIRIYLILLGRGDSSALQIAREIRIDRTTVYDILEKLISKGVVSVYLKNKSKQFKALLPNKLLLYFKEKFSSLERIVPELDQLNRSIPVKVSCELFQGREGIKMVLKDLISKKQDYKVMGIRKEYEEVIGFFNEQGILKMNDFKAKESAIVEKSAKFTKLKNGRYRYLDKRLLSPITTLIYSNKVIFFVWVEPYFVVSIESNELKNAQEEYFEILWKAAEK